MPLTTDEQGNIIVCPLVGWHCATAFPMLVILQAQYVTSEPTLQEWAARKKPPQSVQLGMTPAQCRELAQVLLQKAAEVELPTGRPQ